MRRNVRLRVAVMLPVIALILAGCSSAPKPATAVFDTKNRATQAIDAGNRYFDQGDYSKALQFFQNARDLSASIDDRSGMIEADDSIGKCYVALGQTDEAQSSLDEAAQIAAAIGDERLSLQNASDRASLALSTGDAQKALSLLKAYDTSEMRKAYPSETAIILHMIGSSYAALGNYSDAVDFLKRAIAINSVPDPSKKSLPRSGIDRERELATNHYVLASVYSRESDLQTALTEIQTALAVDKKIENSPGIAQDLFGLGAILEKAGLSADAYDAYHRALLAYVSINWADSAKATVEKLIPLAQQLDKTDDLSNLREMQKQLSANGG